MTVRQYIGARYVPLFADPIQWDSTSSYEPLTVVMNLGTSYVSKQSVPAGIEITNETYWLRWADYNAQLEEYIRQVQTYSASITALNEALPIANFDDENTVKDIIDALDTAIDERLDIIEANSWVGTDRIADNAVTNGKIADGAVTSVKIADGTITSADIANYAITPEKIAKKRVVFIGDSYGLGYTPDGSVTSWIDYASSVLNASGWNVSKISSGGICFGDNTFLLNLQTLVGNMTTSQIKEVELVYCGGGFNDRDMSNNAIHAGIIAFDNYIKATFPNIKRAVIDCFGMGVEGRTSGTFASYTFAKMCRTYESYITACNDNNTLCKIAADGIGVLRRNSYFSSDYVHPNSKGQHAIANHVISIINGNGNGINTYATDEYLTISDGVHSIGIIGVQTGEHEILCWCNSTINLDMQNAPGQLTANSFDTGYEFTCTAGFQIRHNFTIPIMMFFQNSDNKYYVCPGKLIFGAANRKMYIMCEHINDNRGSYLTCDDTSVSIRVMTETFSIPFKPVA